MNVNSATRERSPIKNRSLTEAARDIVITALTSEKSAFVHEFSRRAYDYGLGIVVAVNFKLEIARQEILESSEFGAAARNV